MLYSQHDDNAADILDLPEAPNAWDETARVRMRAWQIAMRAYCAPSSTDRVRAAAARYLINSRGA